MRKTSPLLLFCLVLAAALLTVTPARADAIFTVNVDTSNLVYGAAQSYTFAVNFQLNGNGFDNNNNSATLTNFSFGGGTAGAVDTSLADGDTYGDYSGNMSGTVSLDDNSDSYTSFSEFFTPGSALSFNVDLTTNYLNSANPPDQFSFAILWFDGGLLQGELPTTDSLASTLTTVNIDSSNPTVQSYTLDPMFTPPPTVTPEPPTLALLGGALLLLGLLSLRRKALSH